MYSVLTNISQLGDLTPEIPLPIPRHILTPTDLSVGIQEEAKEIVEKAEQPMINHLTQMLENSNIDYVYDPQHLFYCSDSKSFNSKLKPTSNTHTTSPTSNPLLQALSGKKFSSLNNILAQPQSPHNNINNITIPGVQIIHLDTLRNARNATKAKGKGI